MSRPSAAALAATRASCSAVAAPDETAQRRRGGAHRVSDLRSLAVDDADHDGQPGAWQPVGVAVITHGDPQVPRST